MLYFLARPSPRAYSPWEVRPTGCHRIFQGPGGGFIAERGGAPGLRVNERIRAREVRVIDDAGNQLGVMTLFDAMKQAREAGLDVVEISPNAVPPVCKLVDYGKFQYELSKKAHEAKKHQKSSHIKEVKFRPSTAEHDFQVRKNQIIRFLGEGHKVKAMIFHRGREMAHQDVGRAKMERRSRKSPTTRWWNSVRGWKPTSCSRCWRRKRARRQRHRRGPPNRRPAARRKDISGKREL